VRRICAPCDGAIGGTWGIKEAWTRSPSSEGLLDTFHARRFVDDHFFVVTVEDSAHHLNPAHVAEVPSAVVLHFGTKHWKVQCHAWPVQPEAVEA